MRFLHFVQRLRANESGNALIMTAGGLPLLFGAAALGIDTIHLVLAKRELQRKADTSALAGAHAVAQSKAAKPAALRVLSLGDQVTLSTEAVVNNGPTSGTYLGQAHAVEVILETRPDISFIPMFLGRQPTIKARAVAARVGSSPACILALDPTEKYSMLMTGNASLSLECSMAANSNHSEAIQLTGNLSLNEVSDITAVGGIDVSGNASVPNSQKHPYSDPQIDPYKDLSIPTSPSNCTYTNLKLDSGTHTLAPGRYCGYLEIVGTAKVTLLPGEHIIAGEYFKINDSAQVTGSDVTIALTQHNSVSDKWAALDWNGNSTVDLSAPKVSSGSPYAGVLIMQDRNAPAMTKNKINGNMILKLRGSLYFPNQWFEWNGNTATQSDCLKLISRVMYLNGNIGLKNKCTSDDGVLEATKVKRVRLVE